MSLLSFFYILRGHGVKITPKEWMDLYSLMRRGKIRTVADLYFAGRTVLVKSEKLYDAFDRAYVEFLGEGGSAAERIDELLDLMDEFAAAPGRSFDEALDLDEILRRFNERLMNQRERHSGGGRHIGQRGYSPFGNSGAKRDGIRVGGEGVHGGAFYVASGRRFSNLREDVFLDGRNIGVALKKLRHFRETGCEDELDIDGTVDKTANNFGDIEVVLKRERRNEIKLLLLIDTGGSMDPHRDRVERLFTIARHLNYFKEFKHYYFHNCIYDFVYEDIELGKKLTTDRLVRRFDSSWKLIVIGDALMSPYELYNSYQFIYRLERSGREGVEWLRSVAGHFKSAVWLNPITAVQWQHQTVKAIGKIFPMYPLTVSGIETAVLELLRPH